jgi:type I restriction enzyme S subunit
MKVRLGDYIYEYSVRNKTLDDIPVYSVTNTRGFCTDYFGKEVASKDKSTYKIVPRGFFAYNPSRINVGSVDWQRNEDKVIVSPLYVVFGVSDRINPQYLYYYLKSDIALTFIRSAATGSVRDNLKFSMLSELPLKLRPLSEQLAVIEQLDKIQAIIALRQQELQKLDELIKARFVEMFGDSEFNPKRWPLKKLSELCNVGSSKRIYQNEQSTEGIPFLRVSDLNSRIDNIESVPELFIPVSKYTELKENGLVPVTGDILVTSRGTLGRCYIVKPKDEFYFQDGMISWLSGLSNQITSLYLSHLFTMTSVQKQIASLQAGSTVAYLSISMLKKLDIMLPPVELQNQFAAFVAQVDKSKVVVQKALDETQTLFDSLMQEYFG